MRDIVSEEGASARASASDWRRSAGTPSLAEVYRSVAVKPGAPGWRKAVAFLGRGEDGYLIAENLNAGVPLLADEASLARWRCDEAE